MATKMSPLPRPPSPLQRITDVLTDRQRQACSLAWADRLEHAQIASLYGITLQAVRQRLYRARQRLRAAGITPPGGRRRLQRQFPRPLASFENV